MWPNDLRGLPNALARSALFGVGNQQTHRELLEKKTIAALKGIEITYSGRELRQDDEDVFLEILHISRMKELGTTVTFTGYAMLTSLGWDKGARGYKRLVDAIGRLQWSSLAITVESVELRQNYTGPLIVSFKWQEPNAETPMRLWEITLQQEIINLFSPTGYTRLDWDMRLQLTPMAKWLHSFYHTHRTPYPYSVATLKELMGSKIKELRQFRYGLRKALDELVGCGFLNIGKIDARTDLVVVERNHANFEAIA
jgi:hypothetical protein